VGGAAGPSLFSLGKSRKDGKLYVKKKGFSLFFFAYLFVLLKGRSIQGESKYLHAQICSQ
jgi:hypothetical protein